MWTVDIEFPLLPPHVCSSMRTLTVTEFLTECKPCSDIGVVVVRKGPPRQEDQLSAEEGGGRAVQVDSIKPRVESTCGFRA